MPTLRVKIPEQSEAAHIVRGDKITVGRRPDNTIQIVDRSVSAYHAELLLVDGHYRLHDLGSTNQSFVDGVAVTDFHLHNACKISFGNIECEFDCAAGGDASLSGAQLEKEMAFLRAENQELLNKIDGLQRQVDILSSARLMTGKADTDSISTPEQVKKLAAERDESRFQISGLKFELDKVREELIVTVRERDAARRASELFQAERAMMMDRPPEGNDKTQRIHLPPVNSSRSSVDSADDTVADTVFLEARSK